MAPSVSGQTIHHLHIQAAAYLSEQVEVYLMHPSYEALSVATSDAHDLSMYDQM